MMFLFAIVVFACKNVYAEEIYYTNHLGVSFTREQYDFYTYLTHDGYQEQVTQDMLDEIAGQDLDDLDVEVIRMCPMQHATLGNVNHVQDDNTYFATFAKSIAMGKYCVSGVCRIVSEVEWFGEANVKSHDLIGAYFDGPSLLGTPTIFLTTDVAYADEETIKYETDGFGAVVVIPEGETAYIDMSFAYQGTGTIFVSYQHAMEPITLANSQLFHIDPIGYGNVFDFYGAAVDVYDGMPGLHMDV